MVIHQHCLIQVIPGESYFHKKYSYSFLFSSLPEPWQDIRGGSFNCTDCLETLPCQNHYLTFGANDLNLTGIRRNRIVLTRSLPVQNLQVVSYPFALCPIISTSPLPYFTPIQLSRHLALSLPIPFLTRLLKVKNNTVEPLNRGQFLC